MKKIIIVDDHPLIRKGLALTLDADPNLTVIHQASEAKEVMSVLNEKEADLIIVDISLPGMNGLELIKHIKAIRPDIKILVVSRHDESLYAERAIRAGAQGYVMKLEASEVILKAIRTVLNGGIYVSDNINKRLLMRMVSGYKSLSQSPLEVLSDRELEVFELTGNGLNSREIAENLQLSIKTVETYRARIKDKLSLNSATELVLHASRWVDGLNTN
ncbi:MAG TPA: response regulator transcription factor [Balneolales bacterium]|jgi:DNA-binding NarL/FixJ family response regulator|nr:response regulator transcription factor [Balneolales bacterium]